MMTPSTLLRAFLVLLTFGLVVSCSSSGQRDSSEPPITIDVGDSDGASGSDSSASSDQASGGTKTQAGKAGGTARPGDESDGGEGAAVAQPAPADSGAERTLSDARQVQAQVMDFADEMSLRLAESIDEIETVAQSIETRTVAHRLKYTVAHGATIIASAQNPRIALVDMYVMIKLQRALLEKNIAPRYFGSEADRLIELFAVSETEITGLVQKALTQDQVAIIDQIIARWLEQNPNRVYAGYVRLAEFSAARQVTALQTSKGRSGSVFGFLAIDPLAGLDPTTREIEQARLFAERAFFYMQRMPMLISWQAELLMIDAASEPESRQVLDSVKSLTESVDRISREVEQLQDELPGIIGAERQSILERLEITIDEQREQAIDQALAGISSERKALIDQLSDQEEQLRPLVTDLRQTVDSATALSDSVRSTTEQFEELAKVLGLDEPKVQDPDAEPTSIKDVTEALRETTRAAEELVRLSESIKGTTDPAALEERLVMIEERLVNAENTANRIMDKAFRLALTLVVVLIAGLLVVVIVGAWLKSRGAREAA
ncbi:MAG: hypothetical protein ACX94C_14390 [Phycisphaerales bacterium]